ncbi:ATP-binding cassette domain-containing protein, partial [Brachybacterium muris]|nr:ATP-binding cassette domain-containing protein [Brachybacterium muris]
MITVHDLAVRVGARLLMSEVSFQVVDGDRVGLVGRNGAGKTTLTKVLSGTVQPTEGRVEVSGELGYLPQDTHSGDDTESVISRILSARGLDEVLRRLRRAEEEMADMSLTEAKREKAMNRYPRLEAEL